MPFDRLVVNAMLPVALQEAGFVTAPAVNVGDVGFDTVLEVASVPTHPVRVTEKLL